MASPVSSRRFHLRFWIAAAAAFTCVTSLVSCSPVPTAEPMSTLSSSIASAVVGVAARSVECGTTSFGTGLVVSTNRVLTSAHVVAGASRIVVSTGEGAGSFGSVVYYDPRHDLAVISVPGFDSGPLPFSESAQIGDAAVVAAFIAGVGVTGIPVELRALSSTVTNDIYGDATVTLEYWTIAGEIDPGFSGAPLVTEAGITGAVFAEAADDEAVGYALTLEHIAPVIERAKDYVIKADTGACLNP